MRALGRSEVVHVQMGPRAGEEQREEAGWWAGGSCDKVPASNLVLPLGSCVMGGKLLNLSVS